MTFRDLQILEAEGSLQLPNLFPGPRPSKDAKYTLAYSRPTRIDVVGSYARRTTVQIGNQVAIDLAITMPRAIFQDKDYLNYRYFHKRAYYLACIIQGIEEAKSCTFAISLAFQSPNHLQPVAIVEPGRGSDDFSKSKCLIRLILAAEEGLFPIPKTLPNKNCVRPNVDGNHCSSSATPFYNASLRSECSSLAYLGFLQAASLRSENFSDACALGSIWIRQRGLRGGGFGSFEWACMMALLLQAGGHRGTQVLSKGYSSYQLFKATLKYISTQDFVTSPVYVQSESHAIGGTQNPILFDGVRGMNILFKMTPWSYADLRHEAGLTLQVLADPLSDPFSACFITKVDDFSHKFDRVISVPLISQLPSTIQELDAVGDCMVSRRKLYQVLKTGLGDRATLIHLESPPDLVWEPTAQIPAQHEHETVQVGLQLDAEQVNRNVDRGPSAEDKESAAAFRSFWGEKAELRRFKDGSIQESLVWSSSDQYRSILMQIFAHVVRRHIGAKAAEGLRVVGHSFDGFLPNQKANFAKANTLYQPVMDAFDTLEKDIRNLDGLPLQIRQISAADPQLRYTSVMPPVLGPGQCRMDPANVYVQFEGSSRWPDDLSAVQRIKIAFLLKIGEVLREAISGLSARLGLENPNRNFTNIAFLDILYPSGAFFRMRIHHEREINLLERILKDETSITASRESISSALSSYKRNFLQAPLHTQALRTLATRFPLLSPCIRLMKKWRNSQLLSGHISDELIEMLTIRTFAHPYPWSAPGSLTTGFLRTLTLISKWDWRSDPLIVDFTGELSSRDIDAIEMRFKAWRKIDPAMNRVAIFAASNVDHDGTTWTESTPSKVVAARFTSLAKAACHMLQEQGTRLEPGALFATSKEDYDFLIHMNEDLARGKQSKNKGTRPEFKNLLIEASADEGLHAYSPVLSYVDELKTLYGGSVLFFHDECQTSVIAGLWSPQTGPRPWKVNLPYSTVPTCPSKGQDGPIEAQIDINKAATLHDIARLGGDMVSRVSKRQ